MSIPQHLHVLQTPGYQLSENVSHSDQFDFDAMFVLPQTVLETALADIWCNVLDIPLVGIHNSFFDLGGDALQSLEMHCLAQDMGLHFSLQQFLLNPTIFGLTQLVYSGSVDLEEEEASYALIA